MADLWPTVPTIFFSAGEVSGDMYGSLLLKAFSQLNPNINCLGVGGPLMQQAGMRLLANVINHSAIGLWENLPHVPYFMALGRRVKSLLRQLKPQLVVLIDFQGFNLQLAAWAKELAIPTVYLMAPQEWLWGMPGGLQRLQKRLHHILAVFPPEAEFYQQSGMSVTYIGHPLLEVLPPATPLPPGPTRICLMPGSRRQEINHLMPLLLALVRQWQSRPFEWVLPIAAPCWESLIKNHIGQLPIQCYPSTQRFELMQQSSLVLGASGNAILEALLLGRPVVALYHVHSLTAWVAQRLLRQPWVSLPNILLQRPVVPELLQKEANPANLADWSEKLLTDSFERQLQLGATNRLRTYLGPPGAMARAAQILQNHLAKPLP